MASEARRWGRGGGGGGARRAGLPERKITEILVIFGIFRILGRTKIFYPNNPKNRNNPKNLINNPMLTRKFFLILFLVLFLTGCSFSNKDIADQLKDTCLTKVEKIVQGDSMAPMLPNGENVILLENYYKCGYSAERGDVIAYNYGGSENSLIKVVKAMGADKVEIFGGRLKINDEIMKNSVGQEYTFTEKEKKMMGLYIKNGHIPQDAFLIFGDNIGDSIDSRKFGAVSATDFVGKFVFDN